MLLNRLLTWVPLAEMYKWFTNSAAHPRSPTPTWASLRGLGGLQQPSLWAGPGEDLEPFGIVQVCVRRPRLRQAPGLALRRLGLVQQLFTPKGEGVKGPFTGRKLRSILGGFWVGGLRGGLRVLGLSPIAHPRPQVVLEGGFFFPGQVRPRYAIRAQRLRQQHCRTGSNGGGYGQVYTRRRGCRTRLGSSWGAVALRWQSLGLAGRLQQPAAWLRGRKLRPRLKARIRVRYLRIRRFLARRRVWLRRLYPRIKVAARRLGRRRLRWAWPRTSHPEAGLLGGLRGGLGVVAGGVTVQNPIRGWAGTSLAYLQKLTRSIRADVQARAILHFRPQRLGFRQPQVRYRPGFLTHWRRHRRQGQRRLGLPVGHRQRRFTRLVARLRRVASFSYFRLAQLGLSWLVSMSWLGGGDLVTSDPTGRGVVLGGWVLISGHRITNPYVQVYMGDLVLLRLPSSKSKLRAPTVAAAQPPRSLHDSPSFLEVDELVSGFALLSEPRHWSVWGALGAALLPFTTVRCYNWKYLT